MLLTALLVLGVRALPDALGYKTYVVLSGSMAPAIRAGAVVMAASVPPGTLKVGDVIVYNRSDVAETVTHRIIDIPNGGDRPTFITKADAEPAPDTWTVQYAGNTAGKIVLSLPYAGYVYQLMEVPFGKVLFVVLPAIGLSILWGRELLGRR